MVVPVRSLGIRHLTHDEVARGDLVTYVLKKPLACVFLSFVSHLGHRLFIVRDRGFCSCWDVALSVGQALSRARTVPLVP